MAGPDFGYKEGERSIQSLPVKASETWENGDLLVFSSGYLAKAASGGKPIGVAFGAVSTAASNNGDFTAQVDISEQSIMYYTVGTGTVTQAMIGTTCDIASASTLDVTASADDNLLIVRVDVANNAAWVRLRASAVAAGVV